MPLAPILNQGQHLWFTYDLKTMCVNAVAIVLSIVANSMSIPLSAEAVSIQLLNAAVIDNTSITNAAGADNLQNIVCEGD